MSIPELRDLLSLLDYEIGTKTIKSWNSDRREEVGRWAKAEFDRRTSKYPRYEESAMGYFFGDVPEFLKKYKEKTDA